MLSRAGMPWLLEPDSRLQNKETSDDKLQDVDAVNPSRTQLSLRSVGPMCGLPR